MKTLLAAVDESELQIPPPRLEKAGVETAATLGALQLALADMAIDLSQLDESEPGDRGLETLSRRRPRRLCPAAGRCDR